MTNNQANILDYLLMLSINSEIVFEIIEVRVNPKVYQELIETRPQLINSKKLKVISSSKLKGDNFSILIKKWTTFTAESTGSGKVDSQKEKLWMPSNEQMPTKKSTPTSTSSPIVMLKDIR